MEIEWEIEWGQSGEISREMLKNELRLKLPSLAASCESSGKIPAEKESWQKQ